MVYVSIHLIGDVLKSIKTSSFFSRSISQQRSMLLMILFHPFCFNLSCNLRMVEESFL